MSSAARLRLQYSLDTPLPVRAVAGVIRIKGWCFADGGEAALQVQLRVGGLTLTAPANAPRHDVAAAFPKIPHATVSGFEISGHAPAGLLVAELWAGREGFGWQRLLSFSIYSEAALLHGAIDLPLNTEITSNLKVEGWCFHPQREIAELWLHYGSCRVRCVHYGHERKDVARQFLHLPQARTSGFSSEAILNPGEGRIRLKAVDHEGGEFYCETQHFVRLKAAPSIHTSLDPRLDGRALFQAFSSRQNSLPPLRIILPFSDLESVQRVTTSLSALPGDNCRIIVLAQPTNELLALADKNPRLTVTSELAVDANAWDLRLGREDTPNIHGLLAVWLAAAEYPKLDAVMGDFTQGADRKLCEQPPWSRELVLSGGIHPSAPVLIRRSIPLEPNWPVPIFLASIQAKVAHVPAVLVHRAVIDPVDFTALRPWLEKARPLTAVSSATQPDRAIFSPRPHFQRPAVTAIVLGEEASLSPLKGIFANTVDHWLSAPDLKILAEAVKTAPEGNLLFLTPDSQPVSDSLVNTLSVHLASNPGSAVVPLLLQPSFAPWVDTDYFASRTLRTLSAFDPAYASWANRALTLFTRQTPYVAFPGLLMARNRLLELGGIDTKFESITGSLLDLAFRLRAAGTPPVLCAEARLTDRPDTALSPFEETLLLDRWDRDDANPLRIRPLVTPEVMA